MMRSVLALAFTVCTLHSAEAFTPAARLALGASPRFAAHGLSRKQPRPAVLPALRMADQPDQVIDFGKVGFSEAENQVCTPDRTRRASVRISLGLCTLLACVLAGVRSVCSGARSGALFKS